MREPSAPCDAGSPIRLGVVGLGDIWNSQAEALRLSPHFILAAAADNDPTRGTRIPSNIPFFADHRRLLSLGSVDAVLVSTPLDSHFGIARDALSSGLPVLLEKPATENYDDLVALYSIASASGALLVAAFHAAFGLDVRWAAEYLRSEEGSRLGPLTSFWSGFFDPYASEDKTQHRFESLKGSWIDSGVNALSVLALFTDLSSLKVCDSIPTVLLPNQGETAAVVVLGACTPGAESTIHGLIETSWLLGASHKSTVLAFGATDTYLHLDHTSQIARVFKAGVCHRREDCGGGRDRLVNHYTGVFEDFATRVRIRQDNEKVSLQIHRLLFQASKIASKRRARRRCLTPRCS